MKSVRGVPVAILALLLGLPGASPSAAPVLAPFIDTSTYRIGMSHDGNQHDPDDILAVATGLAIIGEANVHGKFVHCDYSNHLGNNDPAAAAEMKASAEGAAQRWGLPTSKLFDCQTNLSGAITSVKNAINASSSGNIFYYACGGPMEVAWRGINASDPAKRPFCTAISHSAWNDGHGDTSQMTHRWSDIQSSGVKTVKIKDQNAGLNSATSNWTWLRDSGIEAWQWLWGRRRTSNFDCSDAGMVYYVLTGRGDQDGTASKLRDLFENGPGGFGGGAPPPPPPGQSPFGGTARAIPGTIQGEDFDQGGEGVAYHDTTAGNSGGAYRSTDVDLEGTSDSGGGHNVGWTAAGEWLEYTVNVTATASYRLEARVASTGSSGALRVAMNGTSLTGTVSVPNTGAWQTWTTVAVDNLALTSGQKVMRVTLDGGGFNLNWIRFTQTGGTSGPAVTGFTLVNADTDQDVGPLVDGGTVNFQAIGTNRLNVRANTSPATVGSVRFALDGNANFQTENAAPYALAGNAGSDYAPWTPALGSHTLTATAYPLSDASGSAGTPLTVSFTVVNQTSSLPQVNVFVEDGTATELGSNPGSFEILRSTASASPLAVNFTLSGTAAAGSDYGSPGGTAVIPAGALSVFVTITPVDDAAVEGSETVVLRLSAGSAYTVGASSQATLTIQDNDAPAPTGPSVTSFTLVNADTNQDLRVLNSGDTIDLSSLPTQNLNVRANTSPATVGSVRFGLDGNSNYRTENVAPYALAGDTNGDYMGWTPSIGSHSLTATPWSSSNASGTAGTSKTITFTVVQ